MRVSAIVPVLNEERFIGECLSSLERQTIRPAEIIVVDGGSTDRSVEVARSFPGVRVYLMRGGSPPGWRRIAEQRDAALRLSRFEVIASCDADSIYPPRWIEKGLSSLRGDVVAVWGPILPRQRTLLAEAICLIKNFASGITSIVAPSLSWRGANLIFLRDAFGGFVGKYDSDVWNLFSSKRYGRIVYDHRNFIYTDVPSEWIREYLLIGIGVALAAGGKK